MLPNTVRMEANGRYSDYHKQLTHRSKHVQALEAFLRKQGATVLEDKAGVSKYGCLFGSLLQVAGKSDVALKVRQDVKWEGTQQVRVARYSSLAHVIKSTTGTH